MFPTRLEAILLVRNTRAIGADNYTTTRLAERYQARRSQLYKHSIYWEYIMCYDGGLEEYTTQTRGLFNNV